MNTDPYCWEISVFFGKNKSPVQTVETFGDPSDILVYVHWFDECDRFEAIPKPVECITDANFTYDPKPYEAMKMSGPLGVLG